MHPAGNNIHSFQWLKPHLTSIYYSLIKPSVSLIRQAKGMRTLPSHNQSAWRRFPGEIRGRINTIRFERLSKTKLEQYLGIHRALLPSRLLCNLNGSDTCFAAAAPQIELLKKKIITDDLQNIFKLNIWTLTGSYAKYNQNRDPF